MRKQCKEFIDLIKGKGVRARTFKYILVVGMILIFLAFFLGANAIHKVVWTGVLAFWSNPCGYESIFTMTEWVALITPMLALFLAWYAHKQDENREGKGIKDVLTRVIGAEPYHLNTEVIAASMTKQSVLAAIAAVLATVIQLYPNNSYFGIVVKSLSTCGFAFAILFLLVSMVCYDYASRFRWSGFYEAQLVQKALKLDVISWYFLLTSFLLGIALIHPRLSVFTSVVAGVLMWWYYFFRRYEEPKIKIKGVVRIKSGSHTGELAEVISLISKDSDVSIDDDLSYIVELKSNKKRIEVVKSALEEIKESDE